MIKTILKSVGCVAVLALVWISASASHTQLIGPLSFGAAMMISCVGGMLLTILLNRERRQAAVSLCIWAPLGALTGGRLLWCLFFGWAHWMDGGFLIYGAVIGGVIALWLYGMSTGKNLLPLLDMVTPGALFALSIGRLAEYHAGTGYGGSITEAVLLRFPCGMAVAGTDGSLVWRYPVYLWQALAVMVFLGITLLLRGKERRFGRSAGSAAVLLSAE